ncbi:hypothetical protein HPP92_018743 [Vanilla planifolia]|uniref:LOB domain-containing protein n=1 Tax=Vanilla planifolia TaxID=51239 RepID=A0A835QE57_VANPL|nr:hypothetical protein HPP92_018743 [Vanilla planifolia]
MRLWRLVLSVEMSRSPQRFPPLPDCRSPFQRLIPSKTKRFGVHISLIPTCTAGGKSSQRSHHRRQCRLVQIDLRFTRSDPSPHPRRRPQRGRERNSHVVIELAVRGVQISAAKCTQGCVFSPYFLSDQLTKFANVHRVFGASNGEVVERAPIAEGGRSELARVRGGGADSRSGLRMRGVHLRPPAQASTTAARTLRGEEGTIGVRRRCFSPSAPVSAGDVGSNGDGIRIGCGGCGGDNFTTAGSSFASYGGVRRVVLGAGGQLNEVLFQGNYGHSVQRSHHQRRGSDDGRWCRAVFFMRAFLLSFFAGMLEVGMLLSLTLFSFHVLTAVTWYGEHRSEEVSTYKPFSPSLPLHLSLYISLSIDEFLINLLRESYCIIVVLEEHQAFAFGSHEFNAHMLTDKFDRTVQIGTQAHISKSSA